MTDDVSPFARFPQLLTAVREGIDRRLHTGVQVYVSRNSEVLLDAGAGMATADEVLTADASMLWRSAGKPLTALLILQRIEQGRLRLDSTVQQLLDASMSSDVAALTIRQLLTHSSGIPTVETGWPQADWAQSVQNVLNSPAQLPPGSAAYHPQSSWFLLAEIVRQTSLDTTRTFPEVLRRELLEPLGLQHTRCGLHAGERESGQGGVGQGGVIPTIYERERGELVESIFNTPDYRGQPSPGGSLRGPVRELGRFYEVLLRQGKLITGQQFVSPETVREMLQRHRSGQFDQTLQHVVDFGLGIILNSGRYGAETVPYGYGRFASDRTFGHGGSQCAIGFCDPDQQLVVAWAANGFCGEGQHQRRNRSINEAIYRDLGLSAD